MHNYKNISFFEGLNSLRFLAALLVVIHHAESIRHKYGLPNLSCLGLFRNGGTAVLFFFVLSGFLITYLLLKENNHTGTISISKFYLSRLLRIWPLYYLLIIIGTVILPLLFNLLQLDYKLPYTLGTTWYYFVFFLPGLVTFFYGHHFLEALWSIGVEEVFYVIWAPIFKFGSKRILPVLLSIIALTLTLRLIGQLFIANKLFNYLINTFHFDAMAIGGLGAYFVYHREKPLSALLLYKIPVQCLLYLILTLFLLFNSNIDHFVWNTLFKLPVVAPLFINFLFLYLIIGVSLVETNLIQLRSRLFAYLGTISYGIYMYHMMIIFSIVLILKKMLIKMDLFGSTLLFYSLLLVMIILVAGISKYYFENYFLRLKSRLHKKQYHSSSDSSLIWVTHNGQPPQKEAAISK
ncbi:acyltransferase family protein [Chitinophaga defluvii]|uniref:Acyltransferase n=1 Tax=Chitinophaga defluvii TaxID=3163343 RepID=A0ABV2T3Z3_9BACT